MNALEHTSTTSKWAAGAAIAAVVALAISALIAAMAMWVGGQDAMTRSWEGAPASAAFYVAVGLSLCGQCAHRSAGTIPKASPWPHRNAGASLG